MPPYVINETTALYPYLEGVSDALVITCSDPHFQLAFDRFTNEELGIKMPCPIKIPGSISAFGVASTLPKGWYALRGQIELMTSNFKFGRVILINHDGCKGYAKVAEHLGRLSLPHSQRRHLGELASFIQREYLPGAVFEGYQARIVEQDGMKKVKFEKVF